MLRITTPVLALAAVLSLAACGDDAPAAHANHASASVALTAPVDGDRIAGGTALAMSATGISIVPAGAAAPGEGHFHVVADAGCVTPGAAIAKDADHVHFGSGASTGTIYLAPGKHTLCLQIGDGTHLALDATATIDVTVGITSVDEWCDVLAETDALMNKPGAEDEAWPIQQIGFENVRRLLAQLDDGIEHVDADVRAEVDELIGWAQLIADTALAAESSEQANEQLWGPESVLPTDDEIAPNGERWALDTCGVSLA